MDKSFIGSSDPINAELRLEFPHAFEVQFLQETSGTGTGVRYFPAARHHECDGLQLLVVPEGTSPWSGLFAAKPSGRYKSGVYSCPDANSLCVVSNGAGYLLDVRDPDGYQEIPISPVLHVIAEPDMGLLVFANFTDVLAWGRLGKQWLAEHVSFDGIQNLRIEAGILCGLAWSPMDGEHPFALDLATGAASPAR